MSPRSLIMAEDPQAHSKVDAVIPAIGNAFSLVATQWPAHGGFAVLKLLFALASVIGGSLFMLHIVHHRVSGCAAGGGSTAWVRP